MPKPEPSVRPIVFAVVSDVHAGSTLAVCPPTITLDDGGSYTASKVQCWLWECWNDFWQQAAAKRRALGAELYAGFNGDLTDGDHHGTTQILSGNPVVQAQVVNACMAVPLALKPDRILIVRGTEAHVGKSGCIEERIADGLRRDKRPIISDLDTGNASTWHWRAEIHGARLDITHHGRTGQREHTRASAAVLHAHDIFLSHAKREEPYPHLCLRAHYHRFNDSYDACPTRVVTSGAWQLKTAYVHKVAADSIADVGGLLITLRPGAPPEVEKIHYQAARGAVWRP